MKIAIFILTLLVSNSVMADWEFVSRDPDDKLVSYADKSTRTKEWFGNTTMWSLFDFRYAFNANGMMVRSIKRLVEYDCKNKTIKTLTEIYHPKLMGGGTPVGIKNRNQGDDDVLNVPPGSLHSHLLDTACE